MRENGYYWVKSKNGNWVIAHYEAAKDLSEGSWSFCGRDYFETQFEEIGQRVVRQPLNSLEKSQLFSFLKEHSETQGRAGCNDHELPNTEEGRELLKNSLYSGMSKAEAEEWLEGVKPYKGKILTSDFMVFGYLVKRLREIL